MATRVNPLALMRQFLRLPQTWKTPVGRGTILLAAMTLAFGFAMNTSNAVTTNYFADVLHFTGPQFGYITAIREVPGFLLIFITALLYRMSQQRLTALALVVLAVASAGCRWRPTSGLCSVGWSWVASGSTPCCRRRSRSA